MSLPSAEAWGYQAGEMSPSELVEQLVAEVERAIGQFEVVLEGPIPCRDAPGHERVCAVISISATLLDRLMNGRTGYRAQYAVSVEAGEAFNRVLVESVARRIIAATWLYKDRFSVSLCTNSLLGPHSKFWFTNQLTDPSAQDQLLQCPEVIRFPRWQQYWSAKPLPRKGLLAPRPEQPDVLLNGSFLNEDGTYYEQKSGRSAELFESGWT